MPIDHSFDRALNRVVMTATGRVTMAEFDAVRRQMVANPDFDPGCDQLFDITGGDATAITARDIRALVAQSAFRPGARRALVVNANLELGLARMFQIVADERKGFVAVFTDRVAAEAWLANPEETRDAP